MMKLLKIFKLTVAFLLILCLTSCKDWLDVTPKTVVKESEQFNSRQGYIDALFGIYQNAAKTEAYGKNLTFGMLDILAQRYENKSNSFTYYYKLTRYNYSDSQVKDSVVQVFRNMYSSISQANYLLKNVDRGVLDSKSHDLIKGEALGMRGFLHFELARIFSKSYLNGANADAPSIAYVKEFTVTPQSRLTLQNVLNLCEQDLKEAETLLSADTQIDQIADNQGSTASEDLALQFRQNHLNYWAVKAALARLYLYKGDKVNALKYAKEVIESGEFYFVDQQSLNVDATTTTSDLTFSSEHIFSIYMSGLKALADDFFKNSTPTGETTDLWSTRSKLDAIYQSALPGYGTEIRRPGASKSLWSEVTTAMVYSKKYWSDNPANVKQRIIPVIKLAEMYYIAAECAPTPGEGIGYLNEVRTKRLIPALPEPASQEALENEIFLEYQKEFYAEGQLWFYYKRKNTININNGSGNPMNADKYTFPIPDIELEFGTAGS